MTDRVPSLLLVGKLEDLPEFDNLIIRAIPSINHGSGFYAAMRMLEASDHVCFYTNSQYDCILAGVALSEGKTSVSYKQFGPPIVTGSIQKWEDLGDLAQLPQLL